MCGANYYRQGGGGKSGFKEKSEKDQKVMMEEYEKSLEARLEAVRKMKEAMREQARAPTAVAG